MATTLDGRSVIAELVQEQALMLGGLVALHDIDDALIWELARGLDHTRRRALDRLEVSAPEAAPGDTARGERRHPAVSFLLSNVREDT